MNPRIISFLKFLAFSFGFFIGSVGLWLFIAKGVPLSLIFRVSIIMGVGAGGMMWGLTVPPIEMVYSMDRPPPFYYWSWLHHYNRFRLIYIWFAISAFLFILSNMAFTANSLIVAGMSSIVPTLMVLTIGALRREILARANI